MGISERVREFLSESQRSFVRTEELSQKQSEKDQEYVEQRKNRIHYEAGQKERALKNFANTTPIPGLIHDASVALGGQIDTDPGISIKHTVSPGQEWQIHDRPYVSGGSTITYTLIWDRAERKPQKRIHLDHYNYAIVQLRMNGEVIFGDTEKSRTRIRKAKWEKNPKVLEDALFELIKNPVFYKEDYEKEDPVNAGSMGP